MTTSGLAPVVLGPNQPADRPYHGGAGIARFRSAPPAGPRTPEDFVGSTTEIFSGGGVGLSTLPDGRLLRDAIASQAEDYLGQEHVAAFGAEPGLLVKLLDTGERLFVHFHPDDAFARDRLGRAIGKTEAWIVIAVDPALTGPDGGYALVGFRREVAAADVERWVDQQDVPAMTQAMNRVPLVVGDTLLVPAGVAHAIGPGLTLVELQQPTDLSILLEYAGYPGMGPDNAFLGLDRSTALSGLERAATTADSLRSLTSRRDDTGDGRTLLFPADADGFFRAWRVASRGGTVALPHGYGILVVVAGSGTLRHRTGDLPVEAGMTLLVPWSAGPVGLDGELDALFCAPPAPPTEGAQHD